MASGAEITPGRHGQWDVGNANFHEVHGGLVVWSPGQAAGTGLIHDEAGVVKFGHNLDIDTAAREEITEFGNLTRLASASTFDVVSDSSADDGDPAGTGVWTVTIEYLDANYDTQLETVTLNGLSTVTTTGSGLRIQRAWCNGVGSGGVNAGNIAITATTGGTTQAYITAGDGQTHQICYTVPRGKTAYVLGAQFSVAETSGGALKEADAFVEGWIRLYDETSTDNYASWRSLFQLNINNRGSGAPYLQQDVVSPIPEKTDIKIDAFVGVNDTEMTARLFILLRDD